MCAESLGLSVSTEEKRKEEREGEKREDKEKKGERGEERREWKEDRKKEERDEREEGERWWEKREEREREKTGETELWTEETVRGKGENREQKGGRPRKRVEEKVQWGREETENGKRKRRGREREPGCCKIRLCCVNLK